MTSKRDHFEYFCFESPEGVHLVCTLRGEHSEEVLLVANPTCADIRRSAEYLSEIVDFTTCDME